MSRHATQLDALRFALWRFRDAARDRVMGTAHRRAVFSTIYAENAWGDSESVSGGGSTKSATRAARQELPRLFEALGVRSLLDAPCGDFSWMSDVVSSLAFYIGIDIVPELIERNRRGHETDRVQFFCADISADPLPSADMILCRDCLIHLPSRLIHRSLRNFVDTNARFLALTSDLAARSYHDIPVGSFRSIDLRRPPFSFPAPIAAIAEDSSGDRQLCVWHISTIRNVINR